MAKDGHILLRVEKSSKVRYEESAKAAGMTLSAWVVMRLETASQMTEPTIINNPIKIANPAEQPSQPFNRFQFTDKTGQSHKPHWSNLK